MSYIKSLGNCQYVGIIIKLIRIYWWENEKSGEAGKGFAVVTSEISNLSEETARLLEEVNKVVSKLENNTARAKNAVCGVVEAVNEEKKVVIITVNGRGDTVTLAYEEYKRMKSRIELLEILIEAEDDVKNERVAPINDTFDDLRKMLQED